MKNKQQQINSSLIDLLRLTGVKLGDKEKLGSLIGKAMDEISIEAQRKHGMRVENMFAYMAGALGNCNLIKQEDGNGLCLVSDETIKIPDYRVILKNSEMFLAEVKNCAGKKILFKENYLENLSKYASLNKLPLKIAIYWSRFKIWSLISPSHFIFKNGKFALTFDQALALSEMAKLNDRMIGTKAPLSLKLLMNEEKTSLIDKNGQCSFSIGDVQMFCNGNLLTDKIEKDIAFQLILSSQWKEEETVEIVNNKIAYIEYQYSPVEINEKQGFNIVGFLSSIISERFNSSTVHNGEIERLSPQYEPEQFEIFIPEDYKGKALPLWQFIIQPNEDYLKH